jgi:hypothetical protein
MVSALLIMMLLNLGQGALPKDVVVVKVAFRYSTYGKADNRASFVAEFKNTGTKIVSAINWHFVFGDSIRGNVLVDEIRFRTDDKPIKPGEKRTYGKRIDYAGFADTVHGNVEIDRVEYADGTFWQRAKRD